MLMLMDDVVFGGGGELTEDGGACKDDRGDHVEARPQMISFR